MLPGAGAGSRSMNRAVDRRGGAPGLDRRDPPGPLRDRLQVHSHHRVAVPASGDPGVRARRNCRGIRQPADRRRRPVRAVHPRRHAATSRLTGRAVCGRVGCRAYRRQRRDVALGWQCAGQGTSASVCSQTPAHGFLTGPDRAGMLGPGQCRARESSQCGRPVAGRSVAGPSGPGRAEQPRRIPAAAPCSLRESRSESICHVRHGRDRPGYPIVRDR